MARMRPGAGIDYSLRLWGVDSRFSAVGEGQALIEGEVRYVLPWQPASRLAGPPVARQLRRIFRYRQQRVGH